MLRYPRRNICQLHRFNSTKHKWFKMFATTIVDIFRSVRHEVVLKHRLQLHIWFIKLDYLYFCEKIPLYHTWLLQYEHIVEYFVVCFYACIERKSVVDPKQLVIVVATVLTFIMRLCRFGLQVIADFSITVLSLKVFKHFLCELAPKLRKKVPCQLQLVDVLLGWECGDTE